MKKTVIGLFIVSLLVACTTDPYTGEQKARKSALGALAGAAIGAATSSKSDRKKGAAIGAAVGGSIGFYMDRQEQKLRERLRSTDVGVTREGDHIRLNMPGHLTFKTDSSDIQPQFYDVLNSVALVLKEFDKTQVKASGHTDSVGSDAYNQALSEKRAQSVTSYLISQGISAERFYVVGYGESRALDDNSTVQGRANNRRVELEIVPLG